MLEYVELHGKILLIIWFFLIFSLERIAPNEYFRKSMGQKNTSRILKNLSLGLLVKGVTPIAVIYFVNVLQKLYIWKLPNNWLITFVDIMALDLVLYVFHVIAHKNPIIWKFHEIHHLDEDIDSTTGLRIHFAESLISFIFKLPVIYLLAIPTKVYVLYEIILTLVGILHHSNIDVPIIVETLMSRVITMPRMHSVHHHMLPRDINSNYGFVFSIWDFTFKTFNSNQRQHGWKFGLKYAHEKPFIKMLYYPFTKKHLRYL